LDVTQLECLVKFIRMRYREQSLLSMIVLYLLLGVLCCNSRRVLRAFLGLHCKKYPYRPIHGYDILWRVFHITEPVRYMFVSVNRRNNEARAHAWAHRALLFRQFKNVYRTSSVKICKLARKYPWIYGYFIAHVHGLVILSCPVVGMHQQWQF